jgi:hypothetical protein
MDPVVILFLIFWGTPILLSNLHSNPQCSRVSLFPHSHQNLLFLVYLIIAILRNMRWYLIVVLICTSLIINYFEHLFRYTPTGHSCLLWTNGYSSPLTNFFFFCGAGFWTQGLIYARQALCHLSHSTRVHFCDGFFQDRVTGSVWQGWFLTMILLISAFWVARIIGMSHQHPALLPIFKVGLFGFCYWVTWVPYIFWLLMP